jgi:hypothetical protein
LSALAQAGKTIAKTAFVYVTLNRQKRPRPSMFQKSLYFQWNFCDGKKSVPLMSKN